MWMQRGMCIVAVSLLAGCSAQQQPAPNRDQQIVAGAQILGAGCVVLAQELNAAELSEARVANAAALAVLSQPAPDLATLKAAFDASPLPPKYSLLVAILVQQLKVQYGDQLPADSVAVQAADAFLTTCQTALGETAMLDVLRSVEETV